MGHAIWTITEGREEPSEDVKPRKERTLTWDALLVTMERHCVSPSVAHVGAGCLEPICSLLWFPPAPLQVVFHDVAVLTDKLFPIVEAMQKHFSAGSGTYYSDSIFFLSVAMHQIMPKGVRSLTMMCADPQGVARNMAGVSDVALAAGGSGGAAGPNGPREWDCGEMVEQVCREHQAEAGVSGAHHSTDGDQRWQQGAGPLPSSQALREPGRGPVTQVEGGMWGSRGPGAAQGP
ncbi:hypothetical protein MDA_GLEAN10011665 [Myotis davidii]|uniref:Uncharacterized protein n=1 Tax=Myotis davidii TaxID=225400 RepID=L5MIA0_MYODS|nr:hypothetical protein MDA_GLEAN10011665 [Myotis davidii]